MTPLSKIWWESGGVRAIYITINRVILVFLFLLVWHFTAFSRHCFPFAAISRLRVFGGQAEAAFLMS
jgi:hypothetical protein